MALSPLIPRLRLPSSSGEKASITEGSLSRAVWELAWPMVVSNVLMSATGLINVIFVGRLGKESLAVVGLSEQIFFLLMSIVTSVSVGTSALVARFMGAHERSDAETVSRQSLIMAVLGAAVSAFILFSCGRTILGWMNTQGPELSLSVNYLRILALVQVQVFLLIVTGAIFRGIGDTRTPMYIMLTVQVLQVIGDWSLIFGLGPFPKLGVVGAAYSWLFSRTIGAALALYLLRRSSLPGAMHGDWKPKWDWFVRIWAIGIPTAIQQTLRTTGSMVFLGILGHLPNGTASVATLTVGLRIESISFMPGFAYSMAAVTMVGQNLGARQPDRAERSGWVCSWQAMTMMAVASIAFLTIPRAIIHVFTRDPDVVALGIGYLRANGCAQPLLALGIALSGALQGAGETRAPAWITFFTMWLIRVPLTYVFALSLGYGTMAAWVIMAATNSVYGLVITAIYRRGNWKNREV